MSKIDILQRELIKNSLSSVVDEMAYTVIQTARSEIVKDVMDFSTACCDAQGQVIEQGKTIPLHLGAVPEAMEAVIARYQGNIHDGDIFILNDPYEGGMHLPDVFIIMPVFNREVRIGWTVAVAHQTDMGGRVPGSNASDSTEIFQEGLRIPPLKLYAQGESNETLRRILQKNVRVPGRVSGDWAAQVAACSTGAAGLRELAESYGAEDLDRYFNDLLDYSERVVRAEIEEWPDGTYSFRDYLDGDGFTQNRIPINITVTIDGDQLTADYTGTSPQVRGAINATLSFTQSCTYLSVRNVMREDIPNNAGFMRAINVVVPKGTIANVEEPGAVAARAQTGYRMVDCMFGVLAQIVPGRVPAAGEGGNTVVCLSGRNADGSTSIVVDMLNGPRGASANFDGSSSLTHPSQNMSNTPVEILESQHPVRIDRYAIVPDSAGAGQFRGGFAIERSYTVAYEEGGLLQLRADRSETRPWPLDGGSYGRNSLNELAGTDGIKRLDSKVTMDVESGDQIRHTMASGAGYGNPNQRNPQAVLEDYIDGYVTKEGAARDYGVVIQNGAIDERNTDELRRGQP